MDVIKNENCKILILRLIKIPIRGFFSLVRDRSKKKRKTFLWIGYWISYFIQDGSAKVIKTNIKLY